MLLGIERFSLNDGPGIRTTVFLKGCPLHCIWCHNPESQRFDKQLSFNQDLCTGCKACVSVCPEGVHSFESGTHQVDYSRCCACGICSENCMADALKIYGCDATPADVLLEVLKDAAYYRHSEGGVTISGGEPLADTGFVLELLKLLRQHEIHACIETSGAGDPAEVAALCAYTDLFLFDIKADHQLYPELTGISRDSVLRVFDELCHNSARIILRLPMVEGVNDTSLHFEEIRQLAAYDNVIGVEILPYHDTGKGKALQIGSPYHVSGTRPNQDAVNRWVDILNRTGKLINKKK